MSYVAPVGIKPTIAMRGERLRSSHASMDNITNKPIPSPLMNDSQWNGKTWVRPLNVRYVYSLYMLHPIMRYYFIRFIHSSHVFVDV